MIAGLKPYPTMKHSGVKWLREIPEHWVVHRGKNIFRCIDIRSETGEEELLTVSSARGIMPRRSANVTMFKAESYVGHKLCWPCDLVINSLWAWARGLGVSKYHGIISTAYGVYRPKGTIDVWFIHELVRSTPFNWELRVRSKGVWTSRLLLTDDSFLCAPFPIPPIPEQAAIVRYLDYMDKRIRKYIRAKQKLIKLLEEHKQAIIHRAVTRGLDPDVPLKPSGVEWLGDVPEHWEVVAVRRCAKTVKTGGTPTGAGDEHFSNPGFNWYTPGDFKDDLYLRASERQLSEVGKGYVIIFPPNTVMMIGIGATIGKVAISKEYASCNQQINGIVLDNWMDAEYFSLALRSLREYIVSCGKFTTMPIINQAETRSLPILVPPLPEQQKIVEYILSQITTIDQAIDRARREIELLREYRTRLIADVVTGKLDVREAAANLSDEPESLDKSGVFADNDEETETVLYEVPEEAEAPHNLAKKLGLKTNNN